MIQQFRARAPELHAIDLGDGRHLLLTEPEPRYIASAQFLGDYELLSERRTPPRAAPAAVRARKKAAKTSAKTSAKKPTAAAPAIDGDRARGKGLAGIQLGRGEKLDVKAIAAKLGRPYPTVYGWSKKDKWADQVPVAAAASELGEPTGVLRRCEECGARTTRTVCPKGHTMPTGRGS